MGAAAPPASARPSARGAGHGAVHRLTRPATATADSWPHTTRLLPWAIAAFLAVLWLTPFDAITASSVPLPVEATLDRVMFPVVVGLWLSWFLVGRARGNLTGRVTAIDGAMFLFVALAVLSVLVNAQTLLVVDEFELSLKKIAILLSLVLFFYVVATGIRSSELHAFATFIVVLASLAALGVIYEYRTGANIFYNWSADLLPGFFSVEPAPADPEFGRESVTGPTAHAIAIATALAMALPFAFTGLMRSSTTRQRVWHALAITLILAGCIATVRRTGALGPAAALLVLFLYRPRQMLRLVPLGLVVVMATQVLAPSAPSRVKAQFVDLFSDNSVQGRTSDYEPVTPDVRNRLLLGRGYGSYDPVHHRFLDNEWLGRVIETGAIGAVSYLLLILAVILVAHRAGRVKDPVRRAVSVSVVAGAAVYAVTNTVFDALAFPQAPYMFFFIAAMATVALDRRGAEEPQPAAPVAKALPAGRLPRRTFPVPAPDPDRPDLSVVIVTHNGREKALSTLRSARQSTGAASTEWFVVDCGSSDGTPEAILREYPDVTLFRERNIGFAAGTNLALLHARGRYILLLNPDVEIVDGAFSDLVAELDRRPQVAAASVVHRRPGGALLVSIGRDPSPLRQLGEALRLTSLPGLRRLGEMEIRPAPYWKETSADWLVGAFLALRRDAVDEIGPLDERFFLYCEEKDWCYRARQAGWDTRHLPVMTIAHDTPGYTDARLRAQLSYSKLQYAQKHLRPISRGSLRMALAAGHTLRIAGFAPAAVVSARFRERLRGERRALAVAVGASRPAFPPIEK